MRHSQDSSPQPYALASDFDSIMRDDGSDVVPGAASTSQRFRHDVMDIAHARHQVYARPVRTIDSFFVRMGDVLSAALVRAGTSVVVVRSRGFEAINAALAVVALILRGVWVVTTRR